MLLGKVHASPGSAADAQATADALRSDPRSVSEDSLVAALHVLPEHYLHRKPGVEVDAVGQGHAWHGYELALCRLSEGVRAFLRATPSLRGKNPLLDAVSGIVSDPRFGKGRQNFALILCEYGRGQYGPALSPLLADPDVRGHALKALLRFRIPGHTKEVRQLLRQATRAWVRSAAKKYLVRFGRRPGCSTQGRGAGTPRDAWAAHTV